MTNLVEGERCKVSGKTLSLFVWLWLVVNDRKFLAGTVFSSYINQPAVLLHKPATIQASQLKVCFDVGGFGGEGGRTRVLTLHGKLARSVPSSTKIGDTLINKRVECKLVATYFRRLLARLY